MDEQGRQTGGHLAELLLSGGAANSVGPIEGVGPGAASRPRAGGFRGMISAGLLDLLRCMPVRRVLLPLGVGLLLTGCVGANGPLTIRRGEVAPGRYLATVVVKEDGCWPTGLACTFQDSEYAEMILPMSLDTPVSVYEIFAHELCHAVAGLRGLVGPADPCHREDGGRLHAAGRRALR